MSYLVCDNCGGYYELQPGETPDDFSDKCECGGNLKYVQDLDETDDSQNVCPNCGSLIEDINVLCPGCGFKLKESDHAMLSENQLIFGFLWFIPMICFFAVGSIVSLFAMGYIIFSFIFPSHPTTYSFSDIFGYILIFLFCIFLLVATVLIARLLRSKYLGSIKKENLNWTAITVSFIVTIIIGVFGGKYLPNNVSIIGPIIGGLAAGCIVGNRYIDGLVNGGIPAGIAAFIGSIILTTIFGIKISLISPVMIVIFPLLSSITYFMIFFILGSIGGILGAGIRKRSAVEMN